MKEIMAVIRPKKVGQTKDALDKLGFPGFTAVSVLGRGKQRGIAGEVDIDIRPGLLDQNRSAGMKYVPKRLLTIVVRDCDVDNVVRTIIDVNRTGEIGDGRIFVSPIIDAERIRTGEKGEQSVI